MSQVLDKTGLAQYSPHASSMYPLMPSGFSTGEEGHTNTHWRTSIAQSVGADLARHAAMLDATGYADWALAPIKYVKVVVEPTPSNSSSRQPVATAAAEYYDGLEGQLVELERAAQLPDAPVEKGAITSAMTLVKELRRLNYAPPELTWNGGDTVVMLWAFGSTTCAITVTDGEVGYVIRRDRKRLRIRDSIKLEDFKVLSIG